MSGQVRLPVGPLAAAVEAASCSLGDVCRRLEWVRAHDAGADTTRLKRALGLVAAGRVGQPANKTVGYEVACRVCEAIGTDIAEVYEARVLPEVVTSVECPCGELLVLAEPSGLCGFCLAEALVA